MQAAPRFQSSIHSARNRNVAPRFPESPSPARTLRQNRQAPRRWPTTAGRLLSANSDNTSGGVSYQATRPIHGILRQVRRRPHDNCLGFDQRYRRQTLPFPLRPNDRREDHAFRSRACCPRDRPMCGPEQPRGTAFQLISHSAISTDGSAERQPPAPIRRILSMRHYRLRFPVHRLQFSVPPRSSVRRTWVSSTYESRSLRPKNLHFAHRDIDHRRDFQQGTGQVERTVTRLPVRLARWARRRAWVAATRTKTPRCNEPDDRG